MKEAPKPQDGAALIEAEAVVEMLLQAETAAGPKSIRGVANVLMLALAVLLRDYKHALPRGVGPIAVGEIIRTFHRDLPKLRTKERQQP